jgi:hypothetical protein
MARAEAKESIQPGDQKDQAEYRPLNMSEDFHDGTSMHGGSATRSTRSAISLLI